MMNDMEKDWTIEDIEEIRELLIDDESKQIFDARFQYILTGNKWAFINRMVEMHGAFQDEELDSFIGSRNNLPIIIFGAGKAGEHTFQVLKKTKYSKNIYGFCDNASDKWNQCKCGEKIYSIYELMNLEEDFLYIIAVPNNPYAVYKQLAKLGISQANIFSPCYDGIFASTGWQYFDMFSPSKNEVFIDAGAFDGETTNDFFRWCGPNSGFAYLFELNANMEGVCMKKARNPEKMKFIPKGTWSDEKEVSYNDACTSSSIAAGGTKRAAVCSIDYFVLSNRIEKVTFIKFDVEGSEYESLQGCEHTIRTMRPKLAVCAYHKRDDIIRLASYVHELNRDYRLALRHYSSQEWETVLYAF